MKIGIRIVFLWAALSVSLWTQAQVFSNDFENQQEWNLPWLNLHIVADSTSAEENFVCICDSLRDYGLGFVIDKPFQNQNLSCRYGFRFKAKADTKATLVISIDDTIHNRYWASYPLADFVDSNSDWSEAHLDLVFPFDYTHESEIKGFIWNKDKETLLFDDARLEIDALSMSRYLPEYKQDSLIRLGISSKIFIPIVEYINTQGDTINDPLVADNEIKIGRAHV